MIDPLLIHTVLDRQEGLESNFRDNRPFQFEDRRRQRWSGLDFKIEIDLERKGIRQKGSDYFEGHGA